MGFTGNTHATVEHNARIGKKKRFLKLIEQYEQALKTCKMMPSPLCEMQPNSVRPSTEKVIAASIQQKTPTCLQQKTNTPPPSSESMQNVATCPKQLQEEDTITNHNAPLPQQKHAIHNENTMQPPDFQSAMVHLPSNLTTAFKKILHGEIVGIWPISDDCLK